MAVPPLPDVSLDNGLSGRTELRVHGVSGTEPEAILDHPLLRQVSGDTKAGFYRRWYPGGVSPDLLQGRRLEAYSWGRLTSGPAARAAWLLLLPFMLANLAHWMLPAIPAKSGRVRTWSGRASAAVLRLFALGLTLTLLLTTVQIGMDVVGWQCGGRRECAESSFLTSFLADGWPSEPGTRIVISALVPLLVVLGVGLLGRGTLRRTVAKPDVAVAHEHEQPLTRSTFWAGNPGLPTLRTAHVAASAALLAALVAWPATSLAAEGADLVLGAVICLAALAVFTFAVVLVGIESATGRAAGKDGRARIARWTRTAAIVLLGLAAVYAVWDRGDWATQIRLPGIRAALLVSFIAELVLLVVLTVVVAAQRPWTQGEGGYRVAMRGFGAPALAVIAFLVAGGFSAGLTYRVTETLGYPVLSQVTAAEVIDATEQVVANPSAPFELRLAGATAETPLVVPPSFAWAGAATTVIFIAVLVIGAVAALGVRGRIGTLTDDVLHDHQDTVNPDPQATRRVALAIALASVSDRVGRIIGRIVLVAGVVLIVGLGVYAADSDNWELVQDPPLSTITSFGTWLMGLFALGLVLLAWRSVRSPRLRRSVGILWDIGSFWPRTAHPLAPPSYGERAVVDLAERVTVLAQAPHSTVVLSGHSQGSVLVAATILQLPDRVAAQVETLTHGSPLRRLYARFFPAYLGMAEMRGVLNRSRGHWRNLYRDTDPIGSWVLDPPETAQRAVDRRLVDPAELDLPIRGHSDYWTDPGYQSALEEMG